ncbi:hypothetical protein BC834DRAFT_138325 [Gloeopeniophorella convolvens]|nr:hypothetical protein BC834DRAFT_138325 [Gloeopeniophorella convolvens]
MPDTENGQHVFCLDCDHWLCCPTYPNVILLVAALQRRAFFLSAFNQRRAYDEISGFESGPQAGTPVHATQRLLRRSSKRFRGTIAQQVPCCKGVPCKIGPQKLNIPTRAIHQENVEMSPPSTNLVPSTGLGAVYATHIVRHYNFKLYSELGGDVA